MCVVLKIDKNIAKKVTIVYGDPFRYIVKKKLKTHREPLYSEKKYDLDKINLKTPWLTDKDFDYYKTEITTKAKRVHYYFVVKLLDNTTIWYGSRGVSNQLSWDLPDFFNFGYLDKGNVHNIPSWVNDTIWYQIFIERFNNGDKENDPKNVIKWGSEKPTYKSFFGGDIKGIVDKLDYLQDLGINGIYLTPIFEGRSNHKYDTVDYYNIDPIFGDEKVFKRLIKEAKARNIKIMLDGVFNHIGYFSPQWQDIIKNREKSKYIDWFKINDIKKVNMFDNLNKTRKIKNIIGYWKIFAGEYPYEVFGFSPWMPRLNWSNPEVVEYLLNAISKWTKMGIDGWRLDVANELSFSFLRKIRQCVKSINPKCFILGETMNDGRIFLNGDMFDSSMNYILRHEIEKFILNPHKENIELEFKNNLSRLLFHYNEVHQNSMYNLVDSHDKPRVLGNVDSDVRRGLLAYEILFILNGSPSIYYGAEVGLDGLHDPLNRECMIWEENKQNRECQETMKKLISLRRKTPLLRRGNYSITLLKSKLLIIDKFDDNILLKCYINNTDKLIIIKNSKGYIREIYNSSLNSEQRSNLTKIRPFSISIIEYDNDIKRRS